MWHLKPSVILSVYCLVPLFPRQDTLLVWSLQQVLSHSAPASHLTSELTLIASVAQAGARLGVQRALPVQLHLLQPKHGHARMRRDPE